VSPHNSVTSEAREQRLIEREIAPVTHGAVFALFTRRVQSIDDAQQTGCRNIYGVHGNADGERQSHDRAACAAAAAAAGRRDVSRRNSSGRFYADLIRACVHH